MSGEKIDYENEAYRPDAGDSVEPAVERVERQAEERVREEPAEERRPTGPYENKRAAMYEAAKAKREAEEAEHGFRAMPDEIERGRVPPGTETFADREARRNAPPEPVEPQQRAPDPQPVEEPARRKVRVQGRDLELTEDQLVAAAQKGLASENILEDAKRLKAELQNQLEQVQHLRANQSAGQPASTEPRNAQSEDTKPDDAELDDVIDAIQVGDKKEAMAALEKYGQHIERRIVERIGNISQTVNDTIRTARADEQVELSIRTAVDGFLAKNEDFAAPERHTYLTSTSQEIMEGALADVLAQNGVDIEPVIAGVQAQKSRELGRRVSRGEAAAFAYRAALTHGVQLPRYEDILEASATAIRRDFGLPSPQPRTARPAPVPQPTPSNFAAEREERKANINPQPRRANVVPGADAAEKTQEDKNREWIRTRREMLKGRR